MTTSALEREFDDAMMGIYTHAKRQCNYNARVYFDMLSQYRGLETARRLLATQDVQYGFTEVWLAGRLDLTVEFLVLQPKWDPLITDAQREEAKKRLLAHDFPESKLLAEPALHRNASRSHDRDA